MTKKQVLFQNRYFEKTNVALSVLPYQRTVEQKRLVKIVENSQTFSSVFGKQSSNGIFKPITKE